MPSNAQWSGTASIKGSTESVRMALLTLSLVGLQFTWGTEMTYCTPYLLALGLTKSKLSLVWIAGPLSGLIMQPVVGILADRSKSRWGRRRPIMLGGTLVVSACLIVLGWTGEIVAMFVQEKELKREATIALAVGSIYVLDFAINAVQSSCRSLIVDTLPIPKQQLGSAWASRMVAIGQLVVYGAGAVDLKAIFGELLGDTQFKQLTVIAAVALLLAMGTTSWAVEERVLLSDGKELEGTTGAFSMVGQIFTTATHLPSRIRAICWIQFWAWIGWFPFLFYSSTWVGEIYIRFDAPQEVRDHPDTLGNIGRVGSQALIAFSVMTFIGSFVLPWIVQSPEDDEKPAFTPRPPASIAPFVTQVANNKPSLLTAWTVSHLVFTASMVFAPFVASLRSATLLVAFCGIFTFMGIEINNLGTSLPTRTSPSRKPTRSPNRRLSDDVELDTTTELVHLRRPSSESSPSSPGELAGIYLGILNLFTTLPQFIASGISTVVFSVLEPGKSPELAKDAHPDEHHSTDGLNGISVCLFVGALSSVVAAWATRRLKFVV
ncbi:hypothetical protein LTR66_003639 [Elasticomyces elasticus]|nr:hypothetical protein LTR66_003639 [Elasticomyces elasticus]